MEAPPGRYKVIEKDGRLIVIDNATGEAASGTTAPPRPSAPGRPGASPVAPGQSTLDSLGEGLLRIVVREWDKDGRAIVHWSWKQNGVEKRWDAWLDPAEQKRLGRALVAAVGAPILFIVLMFGGGFLAFPGFVAATVVMFWGIRAIGKLQKQTGGRLPPR